MKRHILGLLVSSLLLACGGSEDSANNANTNNNAANNNTANNNAAPPAFAQIYDDIIRSGCSCHLSAEGSGGLAMPDVDTAFQNLVEAPANAGGPCDGRTLVVSGEPAQSVLFQKTAGTADLCGGRMPLGGAALSDAQIAMIEAWIQAGATREAP